MADEIVKNNAPEEEKYFVLRPAADVAEDEDGVEITFEVPGVAAKDVKLEVDNNLLTLVAKSALRKRGLPVAYKRSFYLSDTVDVGKISASARDGVLTLVIPRTERARPHRIQVR